MWCKASPQEVAQQSRWRTYMHVPTGAASEQLLQQHDYRVVLQLTLITPRPVSTDRHVPDSCSRAASCHLFNPAVQYSCHAACSVEIQQFEQFQRRSQQAMCHTRHNAVFVYKTLVFKERQIIAHTPNVLRHAIDLDLATFADKTPHRMLCTA